MHLLQVILSVLLISVGTAASLPERDVFPSDPKPGQKRLGGVKDSSSPEQYFHSSSLSPHYDDRYAEKELDHADERKALSELVRSYLKNFREIGVETWLMHSTLLGWWWNKKILPWESTIRVQVFETDLFFLAKYHNMSVHHTQGGHNYLLEVSPHYAAREDDGVNWVDARWIDIKSGLFINIEAVRYNLTHPEGGMMSCKNGYEIKDTSIIPLRKTSFEGVPAKIPYRYQELLVEEMGERALTDVDFFDFNRFDDETMEWILR